MSGIIFLDGKLIDADAARIDPADRGLTLADGIFDTMLAVDGTPVLAEAHFERFVRHAAVLNIPVPLHLQKFIDTAQELLRINKPANQRTAIRTMLTRGPAPRGLAPPEKPNPTLLMQASPAAGPDALPPVHAVIAPTTRRNEHSPLARIKSLHYGDNLLALMEAKTKDANEAILLNTAGHAACSTAANIFILEAGKLVTPPLSDGVMDGITRDYLLKHHGAHEDHITPQRLHAAQGIILTGSLSGFRPVLSLDGKAFGNAGTAVCDTMAREFPFRRAA